MTLRIDIVERCLFRHGRAAFFLILLGVPVSGTAQTPVGAFSSNPQRKPYEEQRTPGSRRALPPVSLPRPLTRAEKVQLNQTRRVATQLAERGGDSFRRGLMPMGDYLRQLSLSYRLRKSVSKFGVGEPLQAVNLQEVARYREIVGQLEKFRQPAAEGWAADLALAQSQLARMEAEQASFQGDRGAMFAALNREVEWATQHVALRQFDEALGVASPRQVILAKQFERRTRLDSLSQYPTVEEYRNAYEAYRDDLGQYAQQVERWSQQGAGIGRADQLHRVRYELAQANAVLGILDENPRAQTEALKTAEKELTTLFEKQFAYYRKGTTSLFDLARTLADRQSLQDRAAEGTDFLNAETRESHARDFDALLSLSNRVRDRRGRMAADLEFVSALQQERHLVAFRKKMADPFRGDGP